MQTAPAEAELWAPADLAGDDRARWLEGFHSAGHAVSAPLFVNVCGMGIETFNRSRGCRSLRGTREWCDFPPRIAVKVETHQMVTLLSARSMS